jgi:uncharacterized protein YxjI
MVSLAFGNGAVWAQDWSSGYGSNSSSNVPADSTAPSADATEPSDDAMMDEPRDGAERYKMRQKLVSFGDDFWIENDRGERVFKVNGKILRVRKTLEFEDKKGHVKVQIQERMLRVKDSMAIENGKGRKIAEVKRALITPFRERWVVKIGDGPNLEVQGDLLAHEYRIGDGKHKVAKVSKKWFRIRDTYGVQVAANQDDLLVLAITVAIDAMVHPEK